MGTERAGDSLCMMAAQNLSKQFTISSSSAAPLLGDCAIVPTNPDT